MDAENMKKLEDMRFAERARGACIRRSGTIERGEGTIESVDMDPSGLTIHWAVNGTGNEQVTPLYLDWQVVEVVGGVVVFRMPQGSHGVIGREEYMVTLRQI